MERKSWKGKSFKEASLELNNITSTENWIENIVPKCEGQKIKYTLSDEAMQNFANMGVAYTANSEDLAYETIKQVFKENFAEIVEWLCGRTASLRIRKDFVNNVGYILKRDGIREEENNLQVSIHRDMFGNTEYGFFVTSVIPCEN